MNRFLTFCLLMVFLIAAAPGEAPAADGQTLRWTGVNYTKFLWGNRHIDGSMYNFTTIPGEGFGDNGQATEFEILFQSRPSSKIEVNGRIKSRFNQNHWTNFGGFGGNPSADGVGGDRGEFDPRSNEYIKLRGVTVNITPGYSWLSRATIGSSDMGMFDPFTIGKIRYIDRDNGKGLFFNGSFSGGQLTYDLARVSLPRLWAGPNYVTGDYTAQDAAYGLQLKFRPDRAVLLTGIFKYLGDVEHDPADTDMNNGRDLRLRQKNRVYGMKLDWAADMLDLRAAAYYAQYYTLNTLGTGGLTSYTAYPLGDLDDWTYLVNANVDDLGGSGLNLNLQYFNIGSDWVSVMAARRESDVLITEGHEGAFFFPEADNASWKGSSVMGYGGFLGHAQQVATTNVDNEFTDFDEPLAQSVIGWKGFTVVPSWGSGSLDLKGEYSYIDYNTNWQMWGDAENFTIGSSPYVTSEPDAGFGSFRNVYMPFQEKTTTIYMLRMDYLLDVGKGVDVHLRWKYIDEEDLRINEDEFLPANNADVAGYFGAAPNAGQWADFDDLADDDKKLDMYLYEVGAGYQLTDELYAKLTFQHYDVTLVDGNTAFQGNRSHRMAGGEHKKNNLILNASYMVGGAEFGMVLQTSFGEWAPNFGDGFTPTVQDGERGFVDSWGVFQSLEKREYTHHRMKAYMKLLF